MASRSDNLPRRFARIYTAVITDVMDELGLQRQTLPWAIQPLSADMRLAGYAFTARGRPYRGTPRDRDAREVRVPGGGLVGTENRGRAAVRRGMTPLEAYEKFGAF